MGLPMVPARLQVKLFGPLQVVIEGEPMPRVRTRSVEWLLALMILRDGRSASRTWLAGALWPDSDEGQAMQNLRHDLVSLRKALGPEAMRIQSPTRDSLRFDVVDAEIDVLRFDAAMKGGNGQAALEAYAGPLLEGCPRDWAVAERDLRAEQCLQALHALARQAMDRGDDQEAVSLLRRAEAMDGIRDSTAQLLMTALSGAGDLAAAIEVYQNLRRRLHDKLHTLPEGATTRLFHELRASSQPRSTPRPAPNQGRLRPAPFPLSPLVGREGAVQAVRDNLVDYRLVTLVGVGGVGKTRLAIEVSAQLGKDSVAWVDLASVAAAQIVPSVATALGISEDDSTEEATIQRILAHLEEGPLVIALDNCEHVIEEVAALVETLLAGSSRLRVLATSRQRLGLPGEMVWRVPSLDVADAATLPLEIQAAVVESMRYSAVRLFVERARSARPGFQINHAEDLTAVCAICRRLDGIPLALERAAARIATLSPVGIAQRLDDRFSLLTTGARTALPRQKTLKALIAWSYELLSLEEQAILRGLCVFDRGWTLEAAESLYGSGTALDLIASLADKSLVVAEEVGRGIRYRMLETIREFGFARLQETREMQGMRARHGAYYLALAERLGPDAFVSEVGNLNAALAWARQEDPAGAYIRFVVALWPYWLNDGSVFEGCIHVERALDLCGHDHADASAELTKAAWQFVEVLHARQYRLAVRSAPHLTDTDDWLTTAPSSTAALQRALEIQRRMSQGADMAVTLRCLRELAERAGEHSRSVSLAMEAIAISRELGSRLYLAIILHECGCLLYRLKELPSAKDLLAEAWDLFEEPGGEYGRSFASNNLALACAAIGESDRARSLRRYALCSAVQSREWDNTVWSLAGYAESGIEIRDDALCGAMLLGGASKVLMVPAINVGLCERAQAPLLLFLGKETFERAFAEGRSSPSEEVFERAAAHFLPS